jgi:branched-chain amino acid transport system permease protein
MASDLEDHAAALLHARRRWHWAEIGFWLLAFTTPLVFPSSALLLNEIAILALFALSLDLLLGFAGIVSLGHAALFGCGAYVAGLFAKHVSGEPLLGLAVAAMASGALGFASSFLVLRGSDLTRLMVTLGVAMLLGEAANKAAWLTGGADGLQGIVMGPVAGVFEFDLAGRTAYAYSLVTLFLLFLIARRVVASPFGASLLCIRENALRAAAIGIPVNARLVSIYTFAAVYAGVAGALLTQTTQFVALDVLDFHRSADVLLVLVIGGAGTLYGGMLGALAFKLLQDALSGFTPQYWHFWIGFILVALVLARRERLTAGVVGLAKAVEVRVRRRAGRSDAEPA